MRWGERDGGRKGGEGGEGWRERKRGRREIEIYADDREKGNSNIRISKPHPPNPDIHFPSLHSSRHENIAETNKVKYLF